MYSGGRNHPLQSTSQLTAAFNFAVKFYGLRENPCHKAGTMGKKNADEMLFWTNEEFEVFIEAMESRPVGYTVFMVMYYTGLRVGELLALTPEDIDFDRHIISVNKNYQRLNGKDYIYPPKTEAGYREVVMPKVLEACLKDYLSKLYDVQPTDRIFPYDRGWVGRQMKYGCEHSGTQKIRVHDVRHTHASLLIDMGCTPLLVAKRLGHEKVQTTMDTYSHLYPNKHQEVVDMMQNQHRLDETATPAAMLNNTGPNATKFKVVSPNGIMSPKQAHEKRGA